MEHLNTRNIALVTIFASLYYVMSYLPGIPAIGVPGVKIQLEACMASVFGLILGPYLGALAALMGVSVAWALPPGSMSITGLIFLPSPVINALTVGLIYNGGWRQSLIALSLLIAGFWLLPPVQPIGQNFMVGIAATWDKILALLLILPTILLMERIFSGYKSEKVVYKARKYDWPVTLSLVSAILILINAYMIAVSGDVLKLQYEFENEVYKITFGFKNYVRPLAPYGYLWLLTGICILVSAIMLHIKPSYNILWGSLILASSGISAVIGGGFILGLVLGSLGGLLSIIKARAHLLKLKPSSVELLTYFLLAYIGNQADNAWGNIIFAVPAVYEGIFQMPLEAVRWSFLISPYAYFIIRFVQAVIAALVSSPLISNLRAAGFGTLPSLKKMVRNEAKNGSLEN